MGDIAKSQLDYYLTGIRGVTNHVASWSNRQIDRNALLNDPDTMTGLRHETTMIEATLAEARQQVTKESLERLRSRLPTVTTRHVESGGLRASSWCEFVLSLADELHQVLIQLAAYRNWFPVEQFTEKIANIDWAVVSRGLDAELDWLAKPNIDILPPADSTMTGEETTGNGNISACETASAKAVFISYAWGNEGVGIVDRAYDSLKADGYDVRRDKQHLSYTGSITEFMKEFGRAACIVVVVSDKSLRSPYCMFELLEIHRNQQFRERICPIVISDAKIHSLTDRSKYLAHWKEECQRLEKLIKEVGIGMVSANGSFREYEKVRDISQNADTLLTILGDMNTATPTRIEANDFELLKQTIDKRLAEPSSKAK